MGAAGGNSSLCPQVLDKELKDLSTVVSQELECVDQIIISQPQEVPAQLLKALEKDAKNLQKSLSSVSAQKRVLCLAQVFLRCRTAFANGV